LTDSSTGGYLTPTTSPAPLEGNSLQDFFHDWLQGISGLAAANIFPRWQPEPPNLPADTVDWLAFGITKREADTNAAELHSPSGIGYNTVVRQEIISILVSVYGPNADSTAEILREGMQVAQNRETLSLADMGLIECGDITVAPEIVKEKWMYRLDFTFRIRRQITRKYSILSLLSSEFIIDLDNVLPNQTTNVT
jgi:hypothetical protein